MELPTGLVDQFSQVRQVRFDTLEQLGSGSMTFGEVATKAKADADVGYIKVLPALEALPGATKVGTRRFLEANQIAERTKLGDLTAENLETLEALTDV